MSPRAFQRCVLASGFAVAGAYAAVAMIELLVNQHPAVAIPYAYTAVSIAGPLAAVLWLLRTPRHDGPGGEEPGDDSGSGPSGGGGVEPTPPAWWPEFERAFWAYTDARRARRPASDRGSLTPG